MGRVPRPNRKSGLNYYKGASSSLSVLVNAIDMGDEIVWAAEVQLYMHVIVLQPGSTTQQMRGVGMTWTFSQITHYRKRELSGAKDAINNLIREVNRDRALARSSRAQDDRKH